MPNLKRGKGEKIQIGLEKTFKWKVKLILISLLAVLGFDLLLHAGLLARVYVRESPALLGAENAFYRIPFGYLSYLIIVVLIFWILSRFGSTIGKKGYGQASGSEHRHKPLSRWGCILLQRLTSIYCSGGAWGRRLSSVSPEGLSGRHFPVLLSRN